MLIKDSFKKDIYRPIDPVVKPGNMAHLANELDEFVITNEVNRHLQRFLEEYNNPDSVGNGAWISGFFGSGKSHLLKILAVILEDREVEGQSAMDRVLKNVDDEMLAGLLRAARAQHPSESVLFDIDAIAPNQGKSDSGALLAAFIKAFNKHCGYFDGDQQHIAKLEYDLDREGKLYEFKGAIESRCGKPWEDVRRAAALYAAKITAAFDEVCGNPEGTTDNVVTYYKQTYQPDIHSFALRVKEYIDTKPAGFRLNFFVDEVGQFIAQNANLMVNLQSVAVELNTECAGASWVVVTSQENMEDIVGQMNATSANDFSKIQARFLIKMTLTSSDAKEVIRDRLLAKKPEDAPSFEELYEKYHADFNVLFDFADGSKKYKHYLTSAEFTDTYPFVPYQFELFMTAMRGLSDHNAFTGRHNSTGARSMLGVFQGVAQTLCNEGASTEQGSLAAFDAMFEGLRNDLKSEVYAAISQAEDQLDGNPTAVRLLKALLLVKYCQDFKATPGNLRVLLYGSFSEHTAELEQEIKDALDELTNQVYVRRTGNLYEYLTNEEKEIENEIRAQVVQEKKNRELIAEMFDDICGTRRVTYKNGTFENAYPYNLKVDGEGKDLARNELTVNIMTDYAGGGMLGGAVPPTPFKTLSIILKDAREFIVNVRTFNQTEQFINLNTGAGEVREAIIQDKRMANITLRQKLVGELRDLLTAADYNAGGVDITDKVAGSGKDAVSSGVLELVRRSYTGLQQLGCRFTDNEVYNACLTKQMIGSSPEYVESVYSRIALMSSSATNVTIAGDGQGSLTSFFTKGDYGWPEIAVRAALAQLYSANRVEFRKAGSVLEGTALADALKKKTDLDKITVSKLEEVSAQQLADLQAAFKSFAGTNPAGTDPKEVAVELARYAQGKAAEARGAMNDIHRYPFAGAFSSALGQLEACASNAGDWHWVVDVFSGRVTELVTVRSDLEKMTAFAKGNPMQKHWTELKAFLDSEAGELKELGLDESNLQAVRTAVEDPDCFKSTVIPSAAQPMKEMRAAVQAAKSELRDHARAELEAYRKSYFDSYDLSKLGEESRAKFDAVFEQGFSELDATQSPSAIRLYVAEFKHRNVGTLITLVKPPVPTPDPVQPGNTNEAQGAGTQNPAPASQPNPEPKKTVPITSIGSGYAKPVITTAEDVDEYLSSLRAKLMEHIGNGEIISA